MRQDKEVDALGPLLAVPSLDSDPVFSRHGHLKPFPQERRGCGPSYFRLHSRGGRGRGWGRMDEDEAGKELSVGPPKTNPVTTRMTRRLERAKSHAIHLLALSCRVALLSAPLL